MDDFDLIINSSHFKLFFNCDLSKINNEYESFKYTLNDSKFMATILKSTNANN